jgi:hypothetical protein
MAKKQTLADGQVKARVLVDCDLGNCNDVIAVDETSIESLKGIVDAEPAAVVYAESLAK